MVLHAAATYSAQSLLLLPFADLLVPQGWCVQRNVLLDCHLILIFLSL